MQAVQAVGAAPIPGIDTIGVDVRARITDDVVETLAPSMTSEGFPISANITTARRP